MDGPDDVGRETREDQRPDSLEYVAEFADGPPDDLAERVKRVERVLAATVETEMVFEQDTRFVRLKLTSLSEDQLGKSPFDLVEPLNRALDAVSLEPDLQTDFFMVEPGVGPGGGPDEDAALARDSTRGGGCWVKNSTRPPTGYAWALLSIKAPDAWAYSQGQNRPSQGEGIIIAQPDTGITDHVDVDQAAMDTGRWANLLGGGDPIDPLAAGGLMGTPGHGTSTASVVISRGTVMGATTGPPGNVTGSAPRAMLAPIRCVESIIRVSQTRVARAIEHAVINGCHVITMSLGGMWSRSLSAAVRKAVDKNLIVLAAAGNCVKWVVWPARFDRCIAVAGSKEKYGTWRGSCHGPAVDISAPAQHVYRASKDRPSAPPNGFGPGEGTSYAVALTAGVAAMWLAHHGRQNLIDTLGPDERLQDRFMTLARQTARVPPGWDTSRYGAGIINAHDLLQAGMGAPPPAGAKAAALPDRGNPLDGWQEGAARGLLREMLEEDMKGRGADLEAAMDEDLLKRHGLELIWLAFQKRRQKDLRQAAIGVSTSRALAEDLARPENRAIARSLDLGG